MDVLSFGDVPALKIPRPLPLCSVVPDGGTKYPCVSNVVTPLNSVPNVKSLMSPGENVDAGALPLTVAAFPVASAPAESGLLQQSNTVSPMTSNSCVGGVKFDV